MKIRTAIVTLLAMASIDSSFANPVSPDIRSWQAADQELVRLRRIAPVGRTVIVRRPVVRRPVVVVRPVRRWVRRPYFGAVIAGVTLGAIVTVAVAAVAPRAPSPDLCWYWSNNARTRGYWDYCVPR